MFERDLKLRVSISSSPTIAFCKLLKVHGILEYSSFYFSDTICCYFLELPTNCCICDKEDSLFVKVRGEGIKSLIDYSKLRGNKHLAERLPSEEVIHFHEKWRRQCNGKLRIGQKQKAENKPS